MAKNFVMLAAMAALFAVTTACFGLFDRGSEKPRAEVACESLTGQAKIDCEHQRASEGH
jgi:hypothetical protein